MDRKLSLRRETLTELNPAELALVAGGGPSDDPHPTPPIWVLTHHDCVPTDTCVITEGCPTSAC